MDPAKLSGITTWPVPKKLKDHQAFLGFCNFYRRFILNYSTIARPPFELSKKDTPFVWHSIQDSAFCTLKKVFTTAPVLGLPDPKLPFWVITDASDFALGAILEQPDTLNRWHPVTFYSKSMLPAKLNYDIHDKELLAIIRTLGYFRHYLEGHPEPFEVWTDHNNLAYFRMKQKISCH
jgi:RNase H-like domain found in reverse transcriptase